MEGYGEIIIRRCGETEDPGNHETTQRKRSPGMKPAEDKIKNSVKSSKIRKSVVRGGGRWWENKGLESRHM